MSTEDADHEAAQWQNYPLGYTLGLVLGRLYAWRFRARRLVARAAARMGGAK